jgi:hypothetical protein
MLGRLQAALAAGVAHAAGLNPAAFRSVVDHSCGATVHVSLRLCMSLIKTDATLLDTLFVLHIIQHDVG